VPEGESQRMARAAFVVALGMAWAALPGLPPSRPGEPVHPPEGAAVLLFGGRLDPNRAEPAALEALPGIGPARAAAIGAAREEAPFCRVSELRRVRGIGPVTLSRIAPFLQVDPPQECFPERAPEPLSSPPPAGAGGEGCHERLAGTGEALRREEPLEP
jgi:hypothetical protein